MKVEHSETIITLTASEARLLKKFVGSFSAFSFKEFLHEYNEEVPSMSDDGWVEEDITAAHALTVRLYNAM